MLEILACPAPASVQDLGRHGYRHFGVPLSGALDPLALRLANALAGNPQGAAALELRLAGPRLRAVAPVRVALGHVGGRIDRGDGSSALLPAWQSATLAAGDELRLGAVDGGVGYLAVAGGIAVPAVLGSRSAYARAGLGISVGAGTLLPVGEADLSGPDLTVSPPPTFDADAPVRVIPGPQAEAFSAEAHATLVDATYTVTREADRMGLRLAGPRLAHTAGADIVSDAVTPGAIQVPGDGQPIVLLADCQTVGGYAKIATVIAADLPRLGRLLPGDSLRFCVTDAAGALAARREQEAWLASAIAGMRPAGGVLDLDALYSANLVTGVIHES